MEFTTNIETADTHEIVTSEYIDWDYFKNSTILVTGATGLIGSQIILSLLLANEIFNANIKILAHVRNKEKAQKKFAENKTQNLEFIVQDITEQIQISDNVDFIIHTANGTSSKSFVEQPVETIDSIIFGTKNILEYSRQSNVKSIVYLSSMEVYGKTDYNREKPLTEKDYGYIDLQNTRNSYPEAKRLTENLCYSYSQEYNIPVKIARLAQTIGAGIDYSDNRVFAQFARNIVEKKDITLLTDGKTIRSYCYITDVITAIFALLVQGQNGEIYNVANIETTCSIKEMARMLCDKSKYSRLQFIKNSNNTNYYLDTVKYDLDTTKIFEDTKWIAKVSLEEMFNRLIKSFKERICYGE